MVIVIVVVVAVIVVVGAVVAIMSLWSLLQSLWVSWSLLLSSPRLLISYVPTSLNEGRGIRRHHLRSGANPDPTKPRLTSNQFGHHLHTRGSTARSHELVPLSKIWVRKRKVEWWWWWLI
ncbi:hypothetical protein M413DRAFT_33058 [Hebeloma cylindrosporum]|uniref:Uncharacterized protein n=1 Tax=Hebeloma cylindrosporum TaxID=76867 RepID=A0A0C2Y0W7_HEBCY|nr:hypothetical protein M413DRAFT_33058 [Hebeloma cylindrosporum h7]